MSIIIKNKKSKGFTLVELLVVITIIAILAAAVIVNLNSMRAKSRDAKRKADLKNISTALDVYLTKNGGIPSCAWNVKMGIAATFIIADSLASYDSFKDIMPQVPEDPLASKTTAAYDTRYTYVADVCGNPNGSIASAKKYSLYTALEDQSTSNLDPNRGGHEAWMRTDQWGTDSTRIPNYTVGRYW